MSDFNSLFAVTPIALWLQDFSGVKRMLDEWRAAGVTDLDVYLHAHPNAAGQAAASLKSLDVNRATLQLFAARDHQHLLDNMHLVLRDETHSRFAEELRQLWRTPPGESCQVALDTVNYALDGTRLDLALKVVVLPGHEETWDEALVTLDNITSRVAAERHANGLFEHSPVSLWVEDFSAVKELIDGVRAAGVTDFRTFLNVHEDFVERCTSAIRVLRVNRQTLTMLGATSQEELLGRLDEVFGAEMRSHFIEELMDMWHGKLFIQRETINFSLKGGPVNVYLQWSVLPGHEATWDRVQVALTDITARKRAEAYLEFLGKHDALTKLRNRAFFDDEMARLQKRGPWPVGVVVADLNGLKPANDQHGHAAGDGLLRRAAEALKKTFGDNACVARTGGDEFAVLLPGHDERQVAHLCESLASVVQLNNQFYQGPALSFATGSAVAQNGTRLDEAIKQADARMYAAKSEHYRLLGLNRRK